MRVYSIDAVHFIQVWPNQQRQAFQGSSDMKSPYKKYTETDYYKGLFPSFIINNLQIGHRIPAQTVSG